MMAPRLLHLGGQTNPREGPALSEQRLRRDRLRNAIQNETTTKKRSLDRNFYPAGGA